MTTDPVSGIRVLSMELPYSDGSEAGVGSIVEKAADRSSWSDEMMGEASDWAERYHLSPERGNITAPFRLTADTRVLEVGAGTGAVTRSLGETGAHIVALEGNLERARIAHDRCSDLPNVEVVCGDINQFVDDADFDLVIGIGVLEYSATSIGGAAGAEELLKSLAALCSEDGVVAIAIENQLGLKYLLGYNEDHHGRPWIGIEGYDDPVGARTWSKAVLGEMFANVGLVAQRWMYPFPDYKFPRSIIDEGLYDDAQSTQIVDHLCRWPCGSSAEPPLFTSDDRAAHRVFLDAGLGQQIANSFLVVGAKERRSLESLVSPAEAWFVGSARRSPWRRWRELQRDPGGDRRVVTVRSSELNARVDWLSHDREGSVNWVDGPTLDSLVFELLAHGRVDDLRTALTGWRQQLLNASAPHDGSRTNPFLNEHTDRVLPPNMLDCNLSNWVVGPDGSLTLVDREWSVEGGVDIDLVFLRALIYFAHDAIVHSVRLPWPDQMNVRQLASTLARIAGFSVDADLFNRFVDSEAELQAIVQHADVEEMRFNEAALLVTSVADPGVRARVPITSLRRHVAELQSANSELTAMATRLGDEISTLARESAAALDAERVAANERDREVADLRAGVRGAKDYSITLTAEISELRRENADLAHQQRSVVAYIQGLEIVRDHREAMYASMTWRLGSFLLRPLAWAGSLRRGVAHLLR